MKNILTFLILFVSGLYVNAATYYTTGTGDFGDNIWSTTTNGTPGALPALNSGDILIIDDAITVGGNEDLTGNPISLQFLANVEFTGGKLRLHVDSDIYVGDGIMITSSGGGSSDKISFGTGTADWNGSQGDLTGPGSITDGFTYPPGGNLPIVLANFNVNPNSNNINVNWATATEENNDYFTIERSADGKSFHELATVSGAGTSSEALEYTYSDNNPFEGVSYYRLKQTDFDGTSETFKVVAAEFYGKSAPVKVIQQASTPNNLKIYSNLDEENVATIYDAMGRASTAFMLQQGVNNVDLTQFTNRKGIYIVRVVNSLGKELKTERILIQ